MKYKAGDSVLYVNDYGVVIGLCQIISDQTEWYGGNNVGWGNFGTPAYYITPTDTPWFAVPERNLHDPGAAVAEPDAIAWWRQPQMGA